MAKFVLNVNNLVVAAGSLEGALAAVADHFATISRHIGSGRELAECGPEFEIAQTKDDVEAADLTDQVVQNHGAIPLTLDPESPQGKALEAQEAARKIEREAAARAKANEGRSDAEIMADVKAREEAADPANQPA